MALTPVQTYTQLTSAELLVVQQIAGLGDPNADRILFWDDSASSYAFLTAGAGLSIVGTTITATVSGISFGSDNQVPFTNAGSTDFDYSATFTFDGSTLALSTSSITMTGSLGATGARLTKGWFADLEVTNAIVGSITGNAATVSVADEATDTTCFIGFYTAATGSLAGKTNTNLTFNSNTGVFTSASAVLTTADINGGTLDGTVIGGASAAAITGTAITGTSFVIGANTLTTSEWAFLDGQNQTVATTSSPTFVNLTITSFAANWTNAGRTVADMGIVTTIDINGGTIDGTIIGGASAAAGTFTTVSGTTITASTGFALGDGDYVGVTGNEVLTFATAGTITVNGADFMVADTFGAVIGHTAQLVIAGITPEVQIIGTSTTGVDSSLAISNFSTTATSPALLIFLKSDQGTPGSFALLDSGDTIGGIQWAADDGVDYTSVAASIMVFVDGTSGSNDMPGRLVFATTADGAAAPTDRLILDSAGVLKPAAHDGVAFGTTALGFADIFFATGGTIHFENTDWVATHSAGILTIGTGTLKITNPTNTATSAVTIDGTQTLTSKRVTRRLTTTNAPGATPTTNTDNVDIMNFTGLNTAITSMTTNLSGTPVDGDLIEFRFLDDGTARGITWGATFAATTVVLPTTTVISTCLRVGFEWRAASSKWECIATC